ncbi:predicted protein [Sclerotinia sclerotiorum 1980 UF-70]|uniref:Uncharacterized protein n=2 Tax=Sclerotinia sclerotiorum (strain ATCC 18683 / 1980 / Ss-1) TaxID=665079 RepID=A7EGB0_SCLS1|nr:predicted protein [Sclerotinia sclerotiorum 1980 UF-70]APA06973.1 hypothetical protein sscle_02g017430 [Sclerotinia sclerotiorum 1980 UF-70]EDO01876.1 predicted protein [Sclerotinia sclerotiorum 1980 UF-70]
MPPKETPDDSELEGASEDEGQGQFEEVGQPAPPPVKPPRKLKVPKFLTDEMPVDVAPDPANTFKGHEQPSVNERLEQIKTFLADEDVNRCLDFKDKLSQIQEYLAHVEENQLPRDWKLFKDAKVMTEAQADWHERMENSDLGAPICVDSPQVQPFSTRLMSNEVTLAIRETREVNGIQTQAREDRPPFTIQRTKDHSIFLRAIKEDARKTLTDLTEEEQNRNLFKIENRAYGDAKNNPALIPLWTDPIRGLSETGKSQSSNDPWYGNGHVLGVTPQTVRRAEPKHNELPPIINAYQEVVRYYLDMYRDNVLTLGIGDQRHAKNWNIAVLKAFLRLFPTPEAKDLERNANVYSTGQRKGDMTDEEYRVVKDDWKNYNDLQDKLLEHLSAKTTPQVQFYFDEPDMVKTDIYEPTKINIPREYGERIREVREMQDEIVRYFRECRDNGGPQKCNWFTLGRMAEILAPVEPELFGEVGQHWAQFRTRLLPLLWDKAYHPGDKDQWLKRRDSTERAVIDPYIERLRNLWTILFDENPELQREESTVQNGEPWIILLPLQKGALRTDPIRHKLAPNFQQPFIFYVPWVTPKPELSPNLKNQLDRIHRLLRLKDEAGGKLTGTQLLTLRQNLAPFFYPRLRRMYDQTFSDDQRVRDPALKAFSQIFNPWLAGFEGIGIEIRSYKPEETQALLTKTIPAVLASAKDEVKAPQFRQRDPSVLYQSQQRLDPDVLNTLNVKLNRDLPDDGDVGDATNGGWSQDLRKTYTKVLGPPTVQSMREQLAYLEQEISEVRPNDDVGRGALEKERAILMRKCEEEERRTIVGVKAAANSKLKDKIITVLQSVDFVGTDVDTDNLPGVFYLATEPPSPMEIHPTKVNTLSLVPDLDTGLHRNRERNWQKFILGYPEQTSRYDTGTLNFQSKAERRGIQRAAIEMSLNFLASNHEQRRPDDRFRRVLLPSPWQSPLPEVPISMELEPSKRPVELDTKYYTKLMVEYTRWKEDDWYDAREKIIKVSPGQVPPPANYNGPFAIPTMFEFQDTAAKYLGNLTPTWDALLHASNVFSRPFLTAVLARVQRGVDFEPGESVDPLYEEANGLEIRLTPQELGVLRELSEPSWNFHWLPYPPVADEAEDMPRQILDEFERDIDALPEAEKPPYWSSGQPPTAPQIFDIPETQRDFRLTNRYDPTVKSIEFISMAVLLQHINNRRLDQNLPTWDVDTARAHLIRMHKYHHIHFEPAEEIDIQEGLDNDRVARVALTGHPEMKYVESRRRAHNAYGIQHEYPTNTYTVQYNSHRFTGPPIIQPNLYNFMEKASFKFGRAIAMYTEELTLGEDHYTPDLSLEIINYSYVNTIKRSKGVELYPGEPNVPRANPNPNNITLIRIASDLYKVAPDIFTDHGLNPETLLDPIVPLQERMQYAALMIQTQVIEELNNNWESRFPINEKVWGFARDRLVNPVRTVVAGRTFTEYHQPRQYFSMRRWPPCEQSPASQQVIRDSGPVLQTKITEVVVPEKSSQEKKIELLRQKKEPKHIGGGLPNFPFGETPYQQAYLSWRMQEDLKDVPEFNPPPKTGLSKYLPTLNPPAPIDHYALPKIPSSFQARSIPIELLRQRTITAAQALPGLPSLTEYYREADEAQKLHEYNLWKKSNERIQKIEALTGKSWQNMSRNEREQWEGELASLDMEEQRALQYAGGIGPTGDGAGMPRLLDAGERGLVLRNGKAGGKRSRSASAVGRMGKSKKRNGKPSPIWVEPVMSGGL